MFRAFTLFLIRHSTGVLVLAALWAVVGVWIVLQTPMDAVPDLSENQVLVYAEWPGQNPAEIERRITRPLALGFQGLPGVRTVRGSSDVGYSLLHLIFSDSVTFPEARRRAADRLQELGIEFPAGVVPRLAADGIPTGQIFWYTIEGNDGDLAEWRRLQEAVIAPQLRSVPGVAEVATVGGFVAEVHVEADLNQLAAVGLTLSDLEAALVSMAQPAEGQVRLTANSEFLVRAMVGGEGKGGQGASGIRNTTSWLQTLEEGSLPLPGGRRVRLSDVARVTVGAAPRRGVFEKDGHEAVAGIVHLRYGFNPLEVTRDIRAKLQQIEDSLPQGTRLVPCYDRTPLILNAVETVTRTLLESLLVTSVCVVLVMRHWRTSLVIVGTLPLVVLGSFLGMSALRSCGLADVQTNIMSLAGIVVSIGVLVDSSIVVAENVTHQLRRRFGDAPVTGDVSEIVADACTTVGRPVFLSVMMMLISFIPVFALQGIDGRMYRPLAWTKSLALLSAAFLTMAVVPVLCARLIRGRVREESDSAIVRSVVSIYRPVLSSLMDRPWPLLLVLCATILLGAAATGVDMLIRLAVVISIAVVCRVVHRLRWKLIVSMTVVVGAMALQSSIRPIGLALRLPLDEGMVMDMPITVPRVSIVQALDDLKARNMVLCRFPEVRMVTGKAGRAETAFDPAPVDMIETMVEFHARDRWPSRRLLRPAALHSAGRLVEALIDAGLIETPVDQGTLVNDIVDAGLVRFDAIQREVCWQRGQVFQAELSRELATQLVSVAIERLARVKALTEAVSAADVRALADRLPAAPILRLAPQVELNDVHVLLKELRLQLQSRGLLRPEPVDEQGLLTAGTRTANAWRGMLGLHPMSFEDDVRSWLRGESDRRWAGHLQQLNAELRQRSPATWVQIVCSETLTRQAILDQALAATWRQVLVARYQSAAVPHHEGKHTGLPPVSPLPMIDPHPRYDAIVERATRDLSSRLWLWPHDSTTLTQSGGEMDLSVQMPGWANVWTKPIQNRVDMLATGVNSEIGVRVQGRDLEEVVAASEMIASVLRDVPGAADVVADPIRGKGYLNIIPDATRAAKLGIPLQDLNEIIAASGSGRVVSRLDDGGLALPVRLKVRGMETDPVESLGALTIPMRKPVESMTPENPVQQGPPPRLEQVAEIRITDGPATIKSENGWLRNYVRLNVRGRDPAGFVVEAQKHVQRMVTLPPGVFVEWTGQFEHAARTRAMLLWMGPAALILILVILYAAFRDVEDAGLMLLSVPGALAGGVVCQWLLGYPFSVAVGIGYIACFGMAAATSMVMLVYLREAVQAAGGLEKITLAELRAAVINGAVHRLRPKLLTEATTILSLAPMLWSTGMGADVIRPMAAPVLGGILIADEVVDLLLPIAFYAIRRRRWKQLNVVTDNSPEKDQ
jgi:Cu(I)/Ag(I) efflux system membrane protein CusA/SilA